jgi:hypothetical protein
VQPWGKTTQAAYLAQANALKTRINGLPVQLAVAECMALAASIGDGHTNVLTWNLHRWLPLALMQFTDGLFVAATTSAQAGLLGAQVQTVGPLASSDALRQAALLWPAENTSAALAWGQWLLSSANALRWMGASSDGQTAVLRLRRPGVAQAENVSLAVDEASRLGPASAPVGPAALHREFQRPQTLVWSEWLPTARCMYVRYAACEDAAGFARFAADLLAELDRLAPRCLVVDLRGNRGGDSAVWQPLVQGLRARPALSGAAGLRFITDRYTFSAAVDASLDLLSLGALHVGEAPGQSPNFLGNVKTRALTALNVGMNYPTRISNALAGNPVDLVPAVAVLRSSADYFAGRDPALDRALA